MRPVWRGLLALAVAAPLAVCGTGVASAADSWVVQPVPDPGGLGFLTGVSCTSASDCVAVGWSGLANGSALGTIWNGSAWATQELPLPPGTTDGEALLNAVSCPAAGGCVAVGNYYDGGAGRVPLAETWDGSTWTYGTPPIPPYNHGEATLNGISCVSSSSCVAVGDYSFSTRSMAEIWNGSTWTVVRRFTPPPAKLVDLNGVSCASADYCVAVGDYTVKTSHVLVEVWNGSSWARQPAPSPAGVSGIQVTGVSCPAANSCTAVGYGTTTSAAVAFAEHWNGAHWTVQSIPKPSGTGIVPELSAVSCAAADNCIAVGHLPSTSGSPTSLAERSNGHTWVVETTARPEIKKTLTAVSCFAPATCTAVGWSGGSAMDVGVMLAEQN